MGEIEPGLMGWVTARLPEREASTAPGTHPPGITPLRDYPGRLHSRPERDPDFWRLGARALSRGRYMRPDWL